MCPLRLPELSFLHMAQSGPIWAHLIERGRRWFPGRPPGAPFDGLRSRYWNATARSPIKADQIERPLLIGLGANDPRGPRPSWLNAWASGPSPRRARRCPAPPSGEDGGAVAPTPDKRAPETLRGRVPTSAYWKPSRKMRSGGPTTVRPVLPLMAGAELEVAVMVVWPGLKPVATPA